jgi:hypothetical protein
LTSGAADATTKFWCRSRPGDPFLEMQQAAQAEILGVEQPSVDTVKKQSATMPPLQKQVALPGMAIPGLGSPDAAPRPPPPPTAMRPPTAVRPRGRGLGDIRRGIARGSGVQKVRGRGRVPLPRGRGRRGKK